MQTTATAFDRGPIMGLLKPNFVEGVFTSIVESNPAVIYGDRVVSYGELRRLAYGVGEGLLARGLQKGDRVGLWAENSPFFVAAYLGIMRAGLVCVPFQTGCSEQSFGRIAEVSGMSTILVAPRFQKTVQPWAEARGVAVLDEEFVERGSDCGDETFPAIDPKKDIACIIFTSGSTGEPKGVMVSHRNLTCNTGDIIDYIGITSRDRVMVVLPLYYCFGTSLIHTHLMAGGSFVLSNNFMFLERFMKELAETECTGFAGVPSNYQILLRKANFARRSFPHLRWLQQAGGKLPNPFIQELRDAFPHVAFFLMYGQTEATARLSYLPPERLTDKLGSIGKGLASTRLEVLKEDGTPVQPGSDEVGEIVASGDNITLGYWGDPVETAKYFREGKLHTGDLARVDEDGFIFHMERSRDMIKSMGNRITAKEVEEVISAMPEVVEVAVVGVPHEIMGEAVKAFVSTVLPDQLTAEDIKAYCARRLPPFKVPQIIEFLQSLPKTSSGKVDKPRLRTM